MRKSRAVRVALFPIVLAIGSHTMIAQGTPERRDTIKLNLSAASAGVLKLGDRLRVVVSGLQAAAAANQVDPKKLVLTLNGYALRGLPLEQSQDTLVFTLARSDSSRTAWAALLGAPTWRIRRMALGVMRPDASSIPWANPRLPGIVSFRLFAVWQASLAILLAAGFLAAIAAALSKHSIAREPRQPLHLGADRVPHFVDGRNAPPAVSLGQLQLLWWTYLIVCGFLFVWVLTWDYNGIVTPQAMILMGMSMATTAVSKAINNGKRSASLRGIEELLETDGPTAARNVRKTEIRHLIGRMGKPAPSSFWRDLFEVEGGLSISRIQYAIWTVVLGVVWLVTVYRRLSFPEFDSALLALMGISGGAYVMLKVPEQHTVPTETERAERPRGAMDDAMSRVARLILETNYESR